MATESYTRTEAEANRGRRTQAIWRRHRLRPGPAARLAPAERGSPVERRGGHSVESPGHGVFSPLVCHDTRPPNGQGGSRLNGTFPKMPFATSRREKGPGAPCESTTRRAAATEANRPRCGAPAKRGTSQAYTSGASGARSAPRNRSLEPRRRKIGRPAPDRPHAKPFTRETSRRGAAQTRQSSERMPATSSWVAGMRKQIR